VVREITLAAEAAGQVWVALVCSEPLWEHAYSWLLRSAGMQVVGHARDVDRASDLVERSSPSVLLVDADDEVEPTRLLKRLREVRHLRPATHIVVACTRGDHAAHDAALAGGASRVVQRDCALDLLRAVSEASVDGDCDENGHSLLTLRELEILRLVSAGHTNREVARAAWVTEQTVKYHLANIFRRLGVGSRREAAAWAVENGVSDGEPPDAARAQRASGRSISRR
jgi:DNA-binding NarL/FixJ family response regulator